MKQAILLAALLLGIFTTIAPLSAQKTRDGSHETSTSTLSPGSAHSDSLRKRLLYVRNDSLQLHAWRGLKDIGPAIHIQPLDGPDDILEKIEIIEDRMDALHIETQKLVTILNLLKTARRSQETQIEVLEDLSEINRASDMQLQKRLHDLQQQFNILSRRVRAYEQSLFAIKKESTRLDNLSKQYRRQAETLKKDEGRTP